MAKKKGFDFDSSRKQPWAERKQRASIAERAEGPKRATEVAKRLVAMAPGEWPHLAIDEDVVEALTAHSKIQPKARGALRRQLGRIARMLWTHDLDAIEEGMGKGRSGRTEREEQIEALVRWRTRLTEDPHEGITAFLDEFPNADRQRIRQLSTRCAKVAGTPASSKAGKSLLQALKEAAGLL